MVPIVNPTANVAIGLEALGARHFVRPIPAVGAVTNGTATSGVKLWWAIGLLGRRTPREHKGKKEDGNVGLQHQAPHHTLINGGTELYHKRNSTMKSGLRLTRAIVEPGRRMETLLRLCL
jgi:hypothetical protein